MCFLLFAIPLHVARRPMAAAFGRHVAGYQIKDNTHCVARADSLSGNHIELELQNRTEHKGIKRDHKFRLYASICSHI